MLKVYSGNSKLKTAAVAILLLAVLGGVTYAGYQHYHKPDKQVTVPKDVKLAPATKEEKQASDQNKDKLISEAQNSNHSPVTSNGKKQVSVLISSASQSRVTAYVSGVNEEGGTCKATFTQGSTVISRTVSGFSNVSYTQCMPISPDLPNTGSWSVVVSYSSSGAEGTSQTQTL